MSIKQEVAAVFGWISTAQFALVVAAVGFLLAAGSHVQSALPRVTTYNCFSFIYELLESVVVLGSPAQWTVTILGLFLYPALSRTGRVMSTPPKGAVGISSGTPDEKGPGSHCIQLGHQPEEGDQPRGSSASFFKRLRRVLSEGRAQARRLYGRERSLPSLASSMSRKRSYGSRSSKSEDVLSSRFSMDSMRASQQNAGSSGSTSGSGRRGLFQRKGTGGTRWQPSMSRITSGQHLAGLAPSESSFSSATAGKRLEILSHNGFQAVDCLSHELTDPAFEGVRQVVTDKHFLQFGAMIGEASAELALSQAGSAGAVGPEPSSLFGPYDCADTYRTGWELVVEEHKPGLHYWSWRRHLRKGFFMYKSKTVYEAATTAQIIDFTYDMDFRRTWDDSMACQLAIPPPPQVTAGTLDMSMAVAEAKAAGGKSAFMYARTKFPPPMASRAYTYARRCWAKPDDGGCYCISRACEHPSPPPAGGRTVRVTDFVSGYVIRSSKGVFDTSHPAVEVINVYFEDPAVPSGITNMSVRRALWPMVQKAETAFRGYLTSRVHGNLEQPPPERPLAMDSLQAAVGAGHADAARVAAADADAASCMGALPLGYDWRCWAPASPYVLLYRGYMASWRGGRAALLLAISCCMSLWCNATRLCVSVGTGGHSCARGVVDAASAVLVLLGRCTAAGVAAISAHEAEDMRADRVALAGRIVARVLWPWEMLLGRQAGANGYTANHTSVGLAHASSGGSSVVNRLSSHPLPGTGAAAGNAAPRRLSFAPRSSGGSAAASADGMQSPRGSRRPRGGFVRRCAVLAVKVAKVAGAGLLLGRAARTEAAPSVAATQPREQASSQQKPIHVQQQRRLLKR